MNEHKRQAYLRAMDIQPYFPRQVLLGAKPSPVYELPVPRLESQQGELATNPGSDIKTKDRAQSRSRGMDAIDELRAQAAPARKATVTAIDKKRDQGEEVREQDSSAASQEEATLRFSLRYYSVGEGLAVIDEVPQQASSQLDAESRKLLLAIVRALHLDYRSEDMRVEEFSWPIQAGYLSKHPPEVAAARGLAGFLQMRKETDGFTNLLVFADQLESLLLTSEREKSERDLRSDKGYHVTVTHSLASMLAVPLLKRDVWKHLQPLLRRLAGPTRPED